MDAPEPYYCEPKHAPNPENDNGLVKDAKSVADFSAQF